MKGLNLLSAAVALACAADATQAALYYRGNGMVYDSTLNVTWLQDANYAGTLKANGQLTGVYANWIEADGGIALDTAKSWAATVTYGGYSGWRLPKDLDGYGRDSELMTLFLELGNTPGYYPSTGPFGWLNTSFVDAGSGATMNFLNIETEKYIPGYSDPVEVYYWLQDGVIEWASGTYYTSSFHFGRGIEGGDSAGTRSRIWLVRDGDVSQVPVPAAAWLFGSGLAGLAAARRSRKR